MTLEEFFKAMPTTLFLGLAISIVVLVLQIIFDTKDRKNQ